MVAGPANRQRQPFRGKLVSYLWQEESMVTLSALHISYCLSAFVEHALSDVVMWTDLPPLYLQSAPKGRWISSRTGSSNSLSMWLKEHFKYFPHLEVPLFSSLELQNGTFSKLPYSSVSLLPLPLRQRCFEKPPWKEQALLRYRSIPSFLLCCFFIPSFIFHSFTYQPLSAYHVPGDENNIKHHSYHQRAQSCRKKNMETNNGRGGCYATWQ